MNPFANLLMNRCCPMCLRPFVSGDEIEQIHRAAPVVLVDRHGNVKRFMGEVSTSWCVGHAP